jgi:hypothetical protein
MHRMEHPMHGTGHLMRGMERPMHGLEIGRVGSAGILRSPYHFSC